MPRRPDPFLVRVKRLFSRLGAVILLLSAINLRAAPNDRPADPGKICAWRSEAIRLEPTNAETYGARGKAWLEQTNYDQALADWNHLAGRGPEEEAVFTCYRADFYARQGQYAKALNEYQKAIELQSTNSSDACASLALFLAACPDPTCRDGAKALAIAQKAFEREKFNMGVICEVGLAAAYAETGDFAKAAEAQKEAIEGWKFEHWSDAGLADMRERLALYQKNSLAIAC